MPDLIELEVATPERLMVHEQVAEIQLPGRDGYLGILPGHAPLLGMLGSGVLSYSVGGNRHYLAIHGGFVEVLPDHVRVLANRAEKAEDLNLDRARADLKQAQDQVMNPASGLEPAAALEAMGDAQACVDAAEKK